MKFGEIVKAVMKKKGWTQKQLAAALNYKSQSGIAEMLNRPETSTSTDKLVAICLLLNYEVVIRPVGGKAKKGEEYVEYIMDMSNPDAPLSATKRKRVDNISKNAKKDGAK